MKWTIEGAIVFGAVLIAGSIMFTERWEILPSRYGHSEKVANVVKDREYIYRLDRWTGHIEYCGFAGTNQGDEVIVGCPVQIRPPM
jgi:hypothetical protein